MVNKLKKYITLVIFDVIIVLTILIIKGFDLYINYINAFFVGALFILGIGGIAFCSNSGAFDMFGYSGYYIVQTFRPKEDRKYADIKDYIDQKAEKRKVKNFTFIPYLVVGGVTFIVSGLLWLLG